MDHAKFLTRCLQLANYGRGRTSLNPSVGAVIVHNGKIIGEGYHHEYGGPHAEVEAINSVKDPSLLPHSTLYCTLEPCAHHGKTPPCCELITSRSIPHVVIGCADPHDQVDGKGVAHMRAVGTKVEFASNPKTFELAHQSFWINKSQNRPMVTLKWAQSKDGFIDRSRAVHEQASAVSGPLAKIWTHKLRSEVDGILISSRTLAYDRPSLTTRLWGGASPRPVIVESSAHPVNDIPTINNLSNPFIISATKTTEFETVLCDPHDIGSWLPQLLDHQIGHLLVEGGAAVHQSFLNQGVFDQVVVYRGKNSLGGGVAAPVVSPELEGERMELGQDEIYVYR